MSLALYRRYRPETFDEVVGQEHVTEPLQQALRNDRVHHAYLFSGPRGCGKTTSARILARALNCEQGPTPEPCGTCQSCQDLGRGGPGSVDVIEIDAASHGGVDDARDLRERAFFAPAASRYKIYIIDEAHMVSSQGFNALLKVVEEPPPHLKFIFATTEPDKVIGTIRSRTHHYPFRLIPPGVLRAHLEGVCAREGVTVEPAVLSLVVRAGAGSARDALSVLDQLIAGAGDEGVTYAMATALLGYTDAELLDSMIDAFAAGDGATVFGLVDRVIEGGHDPRRFLTDLLERFRDLLVLSAAPDAAERGLVDGPADRLERMRAQASKFGMAELTRAGEVLNQGLTDMRGATAPRLLLELACARVLLPGAAEGERGLAARLERLERRVALGGVPEGPSPAARSEQRPAGAPEQPRRPSSAAASSAPVPVPAPERVEEPAPARRPAEPEPSTEPDAGRAGDARAALDVVAVRRMWPDVLDAVMRQRRFTWILLSQNAQVQALEGTTLTLGFRNAGARDSFTGSGSDTILREVLLDRFGVEWRVEAVVDPSHDSRRESRGPRHDPPRPPVAETTATPTSGTAASGAATGGAAAPPPESAPAPTGGRPRLRSVETDPDDEADADDPSLDEPGLTGTALLERELGAKVIGEFDSS